MPLPLDEQLRLLGEARQHTDRTWLDLGFSGTGSEEDYDFVPDLDPAPGRGYSELHRALNPRGMPGPGGAPSPARQEAAAARRRRRLGRRSEANRDALQALMPSEVRPSAIYARPHAPMTPAEAFNLRETMSGDWNWDPTQPGIEDSERSIRQWDLDLETREGIGDYLSVPGAEGERRRQSLIREYDDTQSPYEGNREEDYDPEYMESLRERMGQHPETEGHLSWSSLGRLPDDIAFRNEQLQRAKAKGGIGGLHAAMGGSSGLGLGHARQKARDQMMNVYDDERKFVATRTRPGADVGMSRGGRYVDLTPRRSIEEVRAGMSPLAQEKSAAALERGSTAYDDLVPEGQTKREYLDERKRNLYRFLALKKERAAIPRRGHVRSEEFLRGLDEDPGERSVLSEALSRDLTDDQKFGLERASNREFRRGQMLRLRRKREQEIADRRARFLRIQAERERYRSQEGRTSGRGSARPATAAGAGAGGEIEDVNTNSGPPGWKD